MIDQTSQRRLLHLRNLPISPPQGEHITSPQPNTDDRAPPGILQTQGYIPKASLNTHLPPSTQHPHGIHMSPTSLGAVTFASPAVRSRSYFPFHARAIIRSSRLKHRVNQCIETQRRIYNLDTIDTIAARLMVHARSGTGQRSQRPPADGTNTAHAANKND